MTNTFLLVMQGILYIVGASGAEFNSVPFDPKLREQAATILIHH